MLDARIFEELHQITEEEQAILDDRTTIDRTLYMQDECSIINSRKLLAKPCTMSKVFGIGVEVFTAGSAEFALSYGRSIWITCRVLHSKS